ncbi:hypothetical protein GCM10011344_25330 [Dokdonia pacifica]|uniref:Uncharacterized protein n=1 Tax=Dokdonia pacifica TaxID=1627892 RepID=A0A238WR27_9FLAO|nr:hypothetical protein [Dokdonia pacifica]GGG23511.1 hypothetical protein GCM10011344_25330 [Dokdonia pacifica]SNR49060.1 hypothetical protein SAMN06265376_1011388 [Dokdonia pacifica]
MKKLKEKKPLNTFVKNTIVNSRVIEGGAFNPSLSIDNILQGKASG